MASDCARTCEKPRDRSEARQRERRQPARASRQPASAARASREPVDGDERDGGDRAEQIRVGQQRQQAGARQVDPVLATRRTGAVGEEQQQLEGVAARDHREFEQREVAEGEEDTRHEAEGRGAEEEERCGRTEREIHELHRERVAREARQAEVHEVPQHRVAFGPHVAQQLAEARAIAGDEPDLELVSPRLVAQNGDETETQERREHRSARERSTARRQSGNSRAVPVQQARADTRAQYAPRRYAPTAGKRSRLPPR